MMVNNKRAKYSIYLESPNTSATLSEKINILIPEAVAISPIEKAIAHHTITGITAFLFLFNNSFKIFMIFTF